MKKEYDLSAMKSRKNPYASKLKRQVTIRMSEEIAGDCIGQLVQRIKFQLAANVMEKHHAQALVIDITREIKQVDLQRHTVAVAHGGPGSEAGHAGVAFTVGGDGFDGEYAFDWCVLAMQVYVGRRVANGAPFGSRSSKLLQRYFFYFRPEPISEDRFFLTIDSYRLTVNAIKLIFGRLAKRSGVSRLHIHLLRHTFATRFLLNGGDAFTLQQILGHTSLEMTRRYIDMVAIERAVKSKRISPMDRILMRRNGKFIRAAR